MLHYHSIHASLYLFSAAFNTYSSPFQSQAHYEVFPWLSYHYVPYLPYHSSFYLWLQASTVHARSSVIVHGRSARFFSTCRSIPFPSCSTSTLARISSFLHVHAEVFVFSLLITIQDSFSLEFSDVLLPHVLFESSPNRSLFGNLRPPPTHFRREGKHSQ